MMCYHYHLTPLFSGIQHISAYQLGVLNPPQAIVDFGAVGFGVRPLGTTAENLANEGTGWLMEQGNNSRYTMPSEESTEAHGILMEYMSNGGGR